MKTGILALIFLTTCIPSLLVAQDEGETPLKPRQTIGWMEKVKISPGDLIMHAKIEPGVTSSYLYAENVRKVRKGKHLFANFELADQYGNAGKFSREILRTVKKKAPEGKGPEARSVTEYVVSLGLCLGRVYFEDEIALTSKKHEDYDMRLGRQALEGNVLIDPGTKFSTSPDCAEKGNDLKGAEESEAKEKEAKEKDKE